MPAARTHPHACAQWPRRAASTPRRWLSSGCWAPPGPSLSGPVMGWAGPVSLSPGVLTLSQDCPCLSQPPPKSAYSGSAGAALLGPASEGGVGKPLLGGQWVRRGPAEKQGQKSRRAWAGREGAVAASVADVGSGYLLRPTYMHRGSAPLLTPDPRPPCQETSLLVLEGTPSPPADGKTTAAPEGAEAGSRAPGVPPPVLRSGLLRQLQWPPRRDQALRGVLGHKLDSAEAINKTGNARSTAGLPGSQEVLL